MPKLQEIPQDSYDYIYLKKQFDVGQNWKDNTVFGPHRYQQRESDSLNNNMRLKYGIMVNNSGLCAFFVNEAFFNNVYLNLYPRLVTNASAFDRFSGENMEILRFGFKSGETDLSGIGYDDGKYILQYGRGRQSWYLGDELDLVISEDANSFDYGMFGLNLENFKFRYFHGFLGNEDDHNRYIVGKGLEWSNNISLILSISETSIYSGMNRPLDLSHLNPISSHLEIELNERQNYGDMDNGNAVWQISMDFLHSKNIRISSNFVVDELIFDQVEIDSGKVNSIAWSNKISIFSKTKFGSHSLFFSNKYVGENTFRHSSSGYNNFVNRGRPLGHDLGNNFSEYNIGYLHLSKKWIFDFSMGKLMYGNRNLDKDNYGTYNPYENGTFIPKGDGSSESIAFNFFYKPNSNIYFFNKVNFINDTYDDKKVKIIIGFDLFFNSVFRI